MSTKSNVVSFTDKNANMYGCQPCPKCGEKYRAPFRAPPHRTGYVIACDDCGFSEDAVNVVPGDEPGTIKLRDE